MAFDPMLIKIKQIDFLAVADEILFVQDGLKSTHFNTSFHSVSEVGKSAPHEARLTPSETPYHFGRWISLITKSRGIGKKDIQRIRLTRSQVQLLVDAAAVSIVTRKPSLAHREDILEVLYPVFAGLEFGDLGLFIRLNACSPKDGVKTELGPGDMSVHTVADVILRLATSTRACNAILNELDEGAENIEIFFLPYDARFRPQLEYRVFCCPGTGKVTAISQCRWHERWIGAKLDCTGSHEKKAEYIGDISEGTGRVHSAIMEELKERRSPRGIDDLALQQGFTFDVIFNQQMASPSDCVLVDLNVFGARSACGSCLFHWVKDVDLLCGRAEEVQFRVIF